MTDIELKLQQLQAALDQARLRYKKICERGYNFKDPVWVAEDRTSDALILDLERQIAAIKNEEYAIPLEFPVRWDVGAPLPHLLQNDYKTILIFIVKRPIPLGTEPPATWSILPVRKMPLWPWLSSRDALRRN